MKRILVETVPEEIRMALIEDDVLIAANAERPSHSHLVGNIYKCRVQNVLNGMQAAFVDIGTKKNAFLYIGDGMINGLGDEPSKIHIGQSFPVEVMKDAWGSKGPRVTRNFSLPGRNVVLMPNANHIAISHRITDKEERNRLLEIGKKLRPDNMGLIIRTACMGEPEEAVASDVSYLLRLWESLMARNRILAAPALLYRDADLIVRVVRDYMTDDVDEVIVDDRESFQRMRELVEYTSPELKERVHFYDEREPIFRAYNIEAEMKNIGARRVGLKSGGFLVFDPTEALTVVDVNTGKFVGRDNLSDTTFRTNIEAAYEIMRQIRLRDIGGIIVIDFIDMDNDEQKESLLKELRKMAKADPVKTVIVGITQLGLVEMTRKKSRHNLTSMLYTNCPCCEGKGYVSSAETTGIHISRDIRHFEKERHAPNGYDVELNNEVCLQLIENKTMERLANELGTSIHMLPRADYHPERYTVLAGNE